MAQCPGCKGDLRWDWDLDDYWVDGEKAIAKYAEEDGATLHYMMCPKCGIWLGVQVENGAASCCGTVVSHPDLSDVNWQTAENSAFHGDV